MTLVASNTIPSTWDTIKDWWHRATGTVEDVKDNLVEIIHQVEQGHGREMVQVRTYNMLNMLDSMKRDILQIRRNLTYMRDDDPEKAQFAARLHESEKAYNRLRILLWPYFKVAGVPDETIDDLNLGVAPIVIGLAIAAIIAIPTTYLAKAYLAKRKTEELLSVTNSKVFITKNLPWIVGGVTALSAMVLIERKVS